MNITPFSQVFTCHRTDISGLVIHTGGYAQTTPGHIWGPGIRTYYLLHYVISGCGWYQVGKELHQLSAGDLFIGYPNEIIKYGADLKDPWQYCWVGFSGLDASYLVKATDFSRKNHVMHVKSEELKDTLIDIYNHYGLSTQNYLNMLSRLNAFFAVLISNSRQETPRLKRNDYLERALSFMETEYHDSITIEEIAAFTGISSSHLYRLFMNEYAISPLNYLTQFRIRRACSMLLQTPTMPVSVIAYSIGYNDPMYFSRIFHKTIGMSPSEYRKNARAN